MPPEYATLTLIATGILALASVSTSIASWRAAVNVKKALNIHKEEIDMRRQGEQIDASINKALLRLSQGKK